MIYSDILPQTSPHPLQQGLIMLPPKGQAFHTGVYGGQAYSNHSNLFNSVLLKNKTVLEETVIMFSLFPRSEMGSRARKTAHLVSVKCVPQFNLLDPHGWRREPR